MITRCPAPTGSQNFLSSPYDNFVILAVILSKCTDSRRPSLFWTYILSHFPLHSKAPVPLPFYVSPVSSESGRNALIAQFVTCRFWIMVTDMSHNDVTLDCAYIVIVELMVFIQTVSTLLQTVHTFTSITYHSFHVCHFT